MRGIGRVRRVRSLSVLATLFVSCAAGGHEAAAVQDRSLDEAAIRARVAAMETALNKRDAEAYASAYLPDGDFIDLTGPRSRGHEVIRREIARLFATLPSDADSLLLAVDSIRFLTVDVAVVDCNVVPAGSRATYVMVRQEDSWKVAAGRVLPPEERG